MTIQRGTGAGILLAVLLATSGCIGFLTGQGTLGVEATPATVADGALSETGYERTDERELVVNRTFDVGGQSRKVVVTNHVTQYGRSVDLAVVEQRAAVFVLLSTPQVKVLNRTFNPVGGMSNRELLERFQSRYGQLEIGTRAGSTTVTALGTETTVEKFSGTARVEGTDVDVYAHVAKIEHDGDFVVAIGVYPRQLPGEEERVLALVRNTRHGE